MYGLTRGALTLIGAAGRRLPALARRAASLARQRAATMGELLATAGLVAAAGLTMALSQLLGGWTKWGVAPRFRQRLPDRRSCPC